MGGMPDGLLVWRSQQVLTGLGLQVSNPWSLPTVSLFMSAKYAQEKEVLCQAALNSYLKKRMTYEQLCNALELCLTNPSREWALLLRFSLAWMSSSARRSVDTRSLTFRSLCVEDLPGSALDTPWVRSICLAWHSCEKHKWIAVDSAVCCR